MNKLKLKQAVVVEGRYDKFKLQSIVDAVILETGGFQIYRDKKKLALIRQYAEKTGIIILTDSDHAGFQIRNYLKGAINKGEIFHVYAPDIYGKERRKAAPTAENKLGVEGISAEILREVFMRSGVAFDDAAGISGGDLRHIKHNSLTKGRLVDDGLAGGTNSSALRRGLCAELGLPENLTANALLEALSRLFTPEEYDNALKRARLHASTAERHGL